MIATTVKPTDRLLTREEAAEVLGLAPGTLANWAVLGKGPKRVRIGERACRYRMSDLIAYMDSLETVGEVA